MPEKKPRDINQDSGVAAGLAGLQLLRGNQVVDPADQTVAPAPVAPANLPVPQEWIDYIGAQIEKHVAKAISEGAAEVEARIEKKVETAVKVQVAASVITAVGVVAILLVLLFGNKE